MKFKGRLPETPICVDDFSLSQITSFNSSPISATCNLIFFLSHMHGDHTNGLCQSWNYGKIYCTKLTAALIKQKYAIDEKLIMELNEDTNNKISLTSTISSSSSLSESELTFNVSCIPVTHCPGAAAFIFDGYWGRIVYTGDLLYDEITRKRFQSALISSSPLSLPSSPSSSIIRRTPPVDIAYIDNTFASPTYHTFLTRAHCVSLILSIIKSHDNCDILLNSDLLGKEDILVLVANKLKVLICVDKDKFAALKTMYDAGYSLINEDDKDNDNSENDNNINNENNDEIDSIDCLLWPHWFDYFTTREDETFIRVWPKRDVNRSMIESINNRIQRVNSLNYHRRSVIGIHLSGWCINQISNLNNIPINKNQTFYNLPYSSHSSFNQLKLLMKDLKPRECRAISSDQFHWNIFQEFIDQTISEPVIIPQQLIQPLLGEKRKIQNLHSFNPNRQRRRRRNRAFKIKTENENDSNQIVEDIDDDEECSEMIDISSDSDNVVTDNNNNNNDNSNDIIDVIHITDDGISSPNNFVTIDEEENFSVSDNNSDNSFTISSDDARIWSLKINPKRFCYRHRIDLTKQIDITVTPTNISAQRPESQISSNSTRMLPSFLSIPPPMTEARLKHLEKLNSLPKTSPIIDPHLLLHRAISWRKQPLEICEINSSSTSTNNNIENPTNNRIQRTLPPLFSNSSIEVIEPIEDWQENIEHQ